MKPKLRIGLFARDWILNGKFHRENGPAVIWFDGQREWYLNGDLHRIDGPAVIYSGGHKSWFFYSEKFIQRDWLKTILTEHLK